MNRILTCLDTSAHARSVIDTTAWVALRAGAKVELLHVVQRQDTIAARHDLSGAVGLGARSRLLDELTALDEEGARLGREQGQHVLRAAADRLAAAGVTDVTATHRHGDVIETILERESGADLVLLGKRGETSDFAKGRLGSQVERAIHVTRCPVLVAHLEPREIRRVFICFDGSASSWRAIEFAASSRFLQGLDVTVGTAGHRKAVDAGSLDRVKQRLPEATVRIVQGTPEAVLPPAWQACDTDLVMMGAYGHSPLRRWIIGSTTTMLLRTAQVPVLVCR